MIKMWKALTQDNKVKLVLFIIGIVFALFVKIWFVSTPTQASDPQVFVKQTTSDGSSPTVSETKSDTLGQKTQGQCSPAVNQTDGNVTINCHGVAPEIVKRLEDILNKNESDLIEAQEKIDHWLNKYTVIQTTSGTSSPTVSGTKGDVTIKINSSESEEQP